MIVNSFSPAPGHPSVDHTVTLPALLTQFQALIASTPAAAGVPGCPDWDARALIVHMGTVLHRISDGVATGAAPSTPVAEAPHDMTSLATWFADRADHLLTTLRATSPEAAVWQPFPAPATVGFWWRRLTHECLVHLCDLHAARSETPTIDPALASDGVDEFCDVALRRVLAAPGRTAPEGSLHFHCTDVHGEWWLAAAGEPPQLDLRREHRKGDAAIRGTAAALLLTLWHRPLPATWDAPEVIGDTAVAQSWTTLPGL